MVITRRLNLDIGKPGQQAALYARKGDTRIYCILAALREGSEEVEIPTDATVILTSTKPDGTVLTLPGLPEDGRAKVYLSSQALTAAGIVTNQLRIINPDGSDLYSPSFDVIVEDCVLPEDAVESSSDFNALTTLIRQTRGLIERTSLTVMGVPYETVEALHEAVPSPYPWSLYAVGASAPYDLYRYVGDENTGYHGWVNHGPIAGIVGPVFIPSVDEHGVISYTNNGGLANPAPVDLVAAAAIQGKFLRYDTNQAFDDTQKGQIIANIGALTYLAQALTDPQKIQSAANIKVLSMLAQTLSDPEKTQVAKNAGVLSLLSQTLTDAQKTLARTNIDAQKALTSGAPLSTASGGLGKTYANLAAIASDISNSLGLKNMALLFFQSGVASVTIAAGATFATLTITYDTPLSDAPIGKGVCPSGTGYPGNNGGRFVSLSNAMPTATQITIAAQVGTAPTSSLSIQVAWWVCGTPA